MNAGVALGEFQVAGEDRERVLTLNLLGTFLLLMVGVGAPTLRIAILGSGAQLLDTVGGNYALAQRKGAEHAQQRGESRRGRKVFPIEAARSVEARVLAAPQGSFSCQPNL